MNNKKKQPFQIRVEQKEKNNKMKSKTMQVNVFRRRCFTVLFFAINVPIHRAD